MSSLTEEKMVQKEIHSRKPTSGVAEETRTKSGIGSSNAELARPSDAMREAQFLVNRLDEYDPEDDERARAFHGHIAPSVSRLKKLLSSLSGPATGEVQARQSRFSHLAIGDTLYHFDGNHRVYRERNGGPVYTEHFRPHTIAGETSRSWIMEPGHWKVNKKDLSCPEAMKYAGRGFFTHEMMEADIWTREHRPRIERLMMAATADQLKQIAAIVGYEPKPTNTPSSPTVPAFCEPCLNQSDSPSSRGQTP